MIKIMGITETIKKVQNFTPEVVDELCTTFARQFVSEKFDMEDLADYEVKIMQFAEERVVRLGGNPEIINPTWLAGLQIEMSLYIGILIGATCMEKVLTEAKREAENFLAGGKE
jgi:hypothetical protein